MDRATVIGIISGAILIGAAMVMGGDVKVFWSLDSVLITLGGTLTATLMSHKLGTFLDVLKVAKKAFVTKEHEVTDVVNIIVRLSDKAKREGLLSLDADLDSIEDRFLREGLRLVIDGTPSELIRNILENEVTFAMERHSQGQGIFETMGAMAPAFGMLGTLIGLVQMLNRLDDPEAVGPGMAVALITTLYGSVLANMVFLPIAQKLKLASSHEMLVKEASLEGILSIQAGDNPRVVQEKLKSFISPKERIYLVDYRREAQIGETPADAG